MTLYSILVTVIGLTLFLFSVVFPKVLNSGREAIKRCLSGELDRYAVAMVDNNTFFDRDIGNEIYIDIVNAKEIEAFGDWNSAFMDISGVTYKGTDYTERLKEIQNSNMKAFGDKNPQLFQGVYLPSDVYKFNLIKLESGNAEDSVIKNKRVALLGHNFKEIPIGSIITVRNMYEYEVVGIISKNQEIIDSNSLTMNLGGLDFDYTINMDNLILLINPETGDRAISSSVNFISFSEGTSYEEGKAVLESIFEDKGTKIKIGKLSDRIDEVMSRTDWILKRFNASAAIFILLSVIGILSIQMMAFFTRKDEIGIWFANGMGYKNVFLILLIENFIKILIAFVLSLGIYIAVLKANNISSVTMYYLRMVLFVYGPVLVLLTGIGIAVGVSLISLVYIRKKTIPDIINGNW
jgi:hypothetical protein